MVSRTISDHIPSYNVLSVCSNHLLLFCFFPIWTYSPPIRRQWGRRDRPVLHTSPVQDENFHHLLFSQHHQQVPLDESRQYSHTSTAPRMLHPAAHLPQQNPIMVDLHDQVTVRVTCFYHLLNVLSCAI